MGGLQKIGWIEKITPVLSIDVELVVRIQKHNLCSIKSMRVLR